MYTAHATQMVPGPLGACCSAGADEPLAFPPAPPGWALEEGPAAALPRNH